MAQSKRRVRRGKQREAFTMEQYSTRALHEEREYGLYWYAWLWKVLRPIMVFLCSVLIVIGMVTIGWNAIYDNFLAPMDDMTAQVVEFEVKSGESVSSVGRNLEEAQLLRSADIFEYLIQFEGLTNSLSYGTYKLSPGMSVSEIVDELTSGNQTNERVITIIPGWTVEDIADYLTGIGALDSRDEFLALCRDAEKFSRASYALRAAVSDGALDGRKYALEGYLAPDTYRIFLSATAESIINTLLTQGNKVVDEVFYADNTEYYRDEEGRYHEIPHFESTLTMNETIILASMIEKEASKAEDFARVSAVFHNRLALGWKLESDPTVTYLTGNEKLALTDQEIGQYSSYNTYAVTGLPAGPICNPSRAALQAALQPDMEYIEEGYLYFCAAEPTSGTLVYARTKAEHEANVAKYRPLWEEYDRQHAAR